jgi:hypothetical protein
LLGTLSWNAYCLQEDEFVSHGRKYLSMIYGLYIVSAMFLSAAVLIDLHEFLLANCERGADNIPLPVTKNEDDYWVVDDQRVPLNFYLLGDIQPAVSNFSDKDVEITYMSSIMTGCCSCGIELLNTRNRKSKRSRPLSIGSSGRRSDDNNTSLYGTSDNGRRYYGSG